MKIEQLIIQYLYDNKEVTLQGIGTFKLDPSVELPTENDKDLTIPENAIQFEYNIRAEEDPLLIDFIVEQTRKMRPLATSDLDSYTMSARQFINIGKPLVIEGLGTVQKNQQGDYEFIPGHFVGPKKEEAPKQLKEKKEEAISFRTVGLVATDNKKYLIAGFALLIIILLAFSIYYFKAKNKEAVENTVMVAPDVAATDTTLKQQVIVDSTKLEPAADTINSNFKIVIKSYNTQEAAQAAYKRLTSYGHSLVVYTRDSATYFLGMRFMTPLSDTTRAKDSLKILFGGNPVVDLKK